MIEVLYQWLKWSHAFVGFVALIFFWVPMVTRKGSRIHRNGGWIYTWAMGFVSLSALIMAVIRISGLKVSTEEEYQFAWFLLLIAWLSASAGWHGLIVLQTHWWKQFAMRINVVGIIIAGVLGVGSLLIIAYGWSVQNVLLKWFPLVGLNLAISQFLMLRSRTQMSPKVWRMREHISGMIGCGIATVTAFTVFGAPRLMGWSEAPLWLWLTPIAVLVPLIVYSIRKYAR